MVDILDDVLNVYDGHNYAVIYHVLHNDQDADVHFCWRMFMMIMSMVMVFKMVMYD